MSRPCQTHINALSKIRSRLDWRLTMTQRTMTLSEKNNRKVERAANHVFKAIQILETIE